VRENNRENSGDKRHRLKNKREREEMREIWGQGGKIWFKEIKRAREREEMKEKESRCRKRERWGDR
jgi:hypothetical protein